MQNKYNIIVIGGGAAGLVSSYIAAAVNAKVVLIERDHMGGDCLNTGCVPSKAIIKSAKFISEMRNHQKYGVRSVDFEFDFQDVMNRVHEKIKMIEPHDSVERYTSLGVEVIKGDAKIIDRHTVEVNGKTLWGKNIILALGAEPFVPPIKGLNDIDFLTSDNLWGLKSLPKRLVVLGGGPIGSEMAQAFSRLGSKVTQVEMAPRILGREDEDVADLIRTTFKEDGINLLEGAKAEEVTVENGQRILHCKMNDGSFQKVEFDEILVAVGRKARSEGIDWEGLGIKLRPNGTVDVDPYMRANGSNIYAAGDITGPYQFTHMASHQAWYCAVNALFGTFKKFKVDYSVVPWVTYTDPEVAQVGLNEMAANTQGIPFEVTKYGLDDLDRAITESGDHGFVKVLTVPGKDKIIGATIVGQHAGEMLTEFTAAMKHGFGLNGILGTIHPYPTWSEGNKFAAGNWKKAHAPEWILGFLRKFHAWRL